VFDYFLWKAQDLRNKFQNAKDNIYRAFGKDPERKLWGVTRKGTDKIVKWGKRKIFI
jgi:hypothetical protein